MEKIMMFYEKVTPLTRDQHKNLKFRQFDTMKFATDTHLVPLAGDEFVRAALDLPIIFIEDASVKNQYMPFAILGLAAGKNDFIDAKGHWAASTYIPAFVRRYPFILAGMSPKDEELAVCFDSSLDNFNTKDGIALFDDKGEPSDFLQFQIGFLNNFKAELERTEKFTKTLFELGLLVKESATVQAANGSKINLQDFWMVNQEKLAKLSTKELERFQKDGTLGWLYYHVASLGNFAPLMDRHMANQEQKPKKA